MPFGKNEKIPNMFIVEQNNAEFERMDMISGEKPEAYKRSLGNADAEVQNRQASPEPKESR